MKRNGQFIAKHILFGCIFTLLWLPLLQNRFCVFELEKLSGAFVEEEKPSWSHFTKDSWFEGSFQQVFSESYNAHIGFRPALIRLNNQLNFDLFKISSAEGVVAGKNGELFEEDYIKAYLGDFFVGEQVWIEKARKLKKIQDTLHALDKTFLVIIEPGKGSLFPENIPKNFDLKHRKRSNYDSFIEHFNKQNVNVLDLCAYFRTIQPTTQYRLFGKGGTHWSYYGAALAADTMIAYLHTLSKKHIPDILIKKLIQKEIRHPDDDIWITLNVLSKAPSDGLIYPEIQFDTEKPAENNALIVGDSFYFNWLNDSIAYNCFNTCDFWYYNANAFNKVSGDLGLVDLNNFKETVLTKDIIIIAITERFHHSFAWNFDNQLYDLFFPIDETALTRYENDVRTDNKLFMKAYQQAKIKDLPLELTIKDEALKIKHLNDSLNTDRFSEKYEHIRQIMLAIRATPEWLAFIEEKAHKMDIPVEQMIRLDAEWHYDNVVNK